MVKDHSDNERKPTAATSRGCSSRLVTRSMLYAPSHRQTAFITSVVEHWLEQLDGSTIGGNDPTTYIVTSSPKKPNKKTPPTTKNTNNNKN